MNYMWDIGDCLDEIEALYKFFKENNITTPDEREYYFVCLMTHLGKKPIGATELTKEELYGQIASQGKTALSIEADENGKTVYKIIKPKEKKDG